MPQTVTPRSRAAATSIEAFAAPVVTSSRRSGESRQGGGVERRPLAHGDDHLRTADAVDEVVPCQVVGDEVDLHAEAVPVGVRRGDLLVVVEHDDAGERLHARDATPDPQLRREE